MAASGARSERVRVHCRVRPATPREAQAGLAAVCSGSTITVSGAASKAFEFDSVFEPAASQQRVYEEVGAPIVQSVLEGYNGTILAYGQTGSGKTYTLLNASGDGRCVDRDCLTYF